MVRGLAIVAGLLVTTAGYAVGLVRGPAAAGEGRLMADLQ